MILYCLVASGSSVLAEYTENTGNFTDIARKLLRQIPPKKHRKSYQASNMIFHYQVEENQLVFLCMADTDSGHRIPFVFLADIQSRFDEQYGAPGDVGELELNDTFGRVLKERMNEFNNNPEAADKYTKLRSDIDSVKNVMIQNIDKVIAREDQIGVLVDQTDHLETQSYTFKKRGTSLKQKLWLKNVKLLICIVILVIIILIILIVIIFLALWYFGAFE